MSKKNKTKCKCPYCETELLNDCMDPVFCRPCGVELLPCSGCGELFSKESEKCPKCGAKR